MEKHAIRVGLFFVGLFVLCLFWRLTMTEAEVINLHMLSLKTLFPLFKGYDVISIVWGGLLSFIYGFITAYIFHSFQGSCCLPQSESKEPECH